MEIDRKAKICPHCRKKQSHKLRTFFICSIMIIIAGCIIENSNSDGDRPSRASVKNQESSVAAGTKSASAQPATEENVQTTQDETDKLPSEYRSALRKAKTYSDTMYMSKAALYTQLTSEYGEKFSAEAAQYAVDNVDADWYANALKKAQSYSDTMYMSKTAIYDQLISDYGEKFEPDEAQYAVNNVVADWNANALKKAQSYQSSMSMSPSRIYDQLTSAYGEKFTAEEANYAIEHLN
jgi:hypothetical protein